MEVSRSWQRVFAVCSITALIWVLAARVLGPSDLWDQTQPRTVAYTTDIVIHGHWLLPLADGAAATKPPLYNWLAVPAVTLMGLSSELAHKAPSVVALCLCWLGLVRWGSRLVGGRGRAIGWLAGMIFLSGYTIFKLAYLARPDLVLTFFMFAGWVAATVLIADAAHENGEERLPVARRRWIALALWVCVGLGALTKGPAVLPLVIYAAVAPRLVAGRWRAAGALEWWWGLPLSMVLIAAWLYGVWRADAAHLVDQLWTEELYGRLTGLGSEAGDRGPIALLSTAPYMVWYYAARFEPWCLFSTLAMVMLWWRVPSTGHRRWHELGRAGSVLHGAVIFVLVTIAFFTFSAGKRADYLAPVYPAGALLAAWWLLEAPPRIGVRAPWCAPACAVFMLTGLTIHNQRQMSAPMPGYGDAIMTFIRESDQRLQARPAPVVFWTRGHLVVRSLLGAAGPGGGDQVREAGREGRPFWLIARRTEFNVVETWLRAGDVDGVVTEVHESSQLQTGDSPIGDLIMAFIEPGTRRDRAADPADP